MSIPEPALEAINEILAYVRASTIRRPRIPPTSVFIGHGRAHAWKELATFLCNELRLPVEEFNSDPAAGLYTSERVSDMLAKAKIAFLVMAAEDQYADGTMHARANVIHEIGFAQGRLGFRRTIILHEEGVADFSNVYGIGYIPYKRGALRNAFSEVTRTLLREGLLDPVLAAEVLKRIEVQ